jgi:hypothetical protein
MKKINGGKKLRRNTIFGTLVISLFLLGALTPVAISETDSPDHEYYWIVHEDETPLAPPYDVDYWYWQENRGIRTEITYGPWDEIWYTNSNDPSSQEQGMIRPIRNESWHQNTWVTASVEATGPGASTWVLTIELWSPNNENVETFEWELANANYGSQSHFWFKAIDWDTEDTIEFFTITPNDSENKDKLDRWLDQFKIEIGYVRGN